MYPVFPSDITLLGYSGYLDITTAPCPHIVRYIEGLLYSFYKHSYLFDCESSKQFMSGTVLQLVPLCGDEAVGD